MVEETLTLNVHGMHCDACARALSTALKSLKGVTDAQVSAERKLARVRFEPERVDAGRIRRVISRAGYVVAEAPR